MYKITFLSSHLLIFVINYSWIIRWVTRTWANMQEKPVILRSWSRKDLSGLEMKNRPAFSILFLLSTSAQLEALRCEDRNGWFKCPASGIKCFMSPVPEYYLQASVSVPPRCVMAALTAGAGRRTRRGSSALTASVDTGSSVTSTATVCTDSDKSSIKILHSERSVSSIEWMFVNFELSFVNCWE